jgi:DNA ligase (NAD+)
MIKQSEEFLNKNIDLFTINDVLKLSDLIKYHSNLYYNKENPVISDNQYDILFKKLEKLENKYNIKNKQSDKV